MVLSARSAGSPSTGCPAVPPRRGDPWVARLREIVPKGRRQRRPYCGQSALFRVLPLLLAQDLVGPCHQGDQIGRRDEAGVLELEVGVADRTGP